MRPFLQTVENMVREMEAMTVSARSHQSDMHDHFCRCMMLLLIHQLQVLRRIKVQLSGSVCTGVDIVD